MSLGPTILLPRARANLPISTFLIEQYLGFNEQSKCPMLTIDEYFFTKKEKSLLDVRGLLYCVVYPSIGKGIKGPIYPSPLFIIEQ